MASELSAEYFRQLTRSAAKLSRATMGEGFLAQQIAEKAAENIERHAREILLGELDKAITKVGEFDYPAFSIPLRRCFNKIGIITFSRRGININAFELVGTWEELEAGISAARAYLGVGKKLGPEDAALFWKWRIYKPAREGVEPKRYFLRETRSERKRMRKKDRFDYRAYAERAYERTIKARQSAYGGKAPYWLWLDRGNAQPFEWLPYPRNSPTNFTYKAKILINELYRDEIIRIATRYTTAINDELYKFFQDPSVYKPGEAIGTIKTRRATRRFFVTEGGILGYRTQR
jgi:hypothetical protein